MKKQKQPEKWILKVKDDWIPPVKIEDEDWGTNLEKSKKEGWGS